MEIEMEKCAMLIFVLHQDLHFLSFISFTSYSV